MLGERLDAGLVAAGDAQRSRPLGHRRHPLRDRGRGRADEAAALEHVERPGALADEVRRRLEAGGPVDAA